MIIEFPEYLPDLPDLNNPGTTVANGVLPGGDSYFQFPGPTEQISTAIDDYPRGAILVRSPSTGQAANFVGTVDKLYFLQSTVTDVSVAGGYALGTDSQWHFTQFGNDVIACSIEQPIQYYTLDTSSKFATLVATLRARYVATVKDFVMVANTFDATDGNVPHRVRWSAIDDDTSWTLSAITQADFNDLDSQYGWITQLVGGDYAVVFQERAITRLDYVGTPLIFQLNTVETNQGTIIPKSVIRVGTLIYYRGIDGFYVFDGQRSISIGSNKVDDYFQNDFASGYPDRVYTGVDYVQQLIFWLYPGSGNANGRPNRMLIYNYSPNATKRWTTADVTVEFVFNAYSIGYTLDNMDSLAYWASAGIDSTNAPSFDSRVFTGQNLLPAAFNYNHKFCTFEAACLDATIETAEYELSENQRTELFKVRPIVSGSPTTVTVQIGYRELQTNTVTYGTAISLNSQAEANCRVNSRYFRFRVNITGGSWEAIGMQILQMKAAGFR